MVAHDRGDSVALLHAARCAEGRSAMRLEHLVLSNANIFLPLSNLTGAQRQALDAGVLVEGRGRGDSLAPGRRHGRHDVHPAAQGR